VFGLISLSPLTLWFVYNVIRLHSASDRELALHLISRADLLVGVRTLTRWFLPFVPDVIGRTVPAAALMVSTVCVLYQVMRRAAEDPESDALAERGFPRSAAILWTTNASLVVWTVTYGVFLLLSISFADRATPLDARILSPALPTVLAMTVGAACALLYRQSEPDPIVTRGPRNRAVRAIGGGVLLVYIASQVAGLMAWSRAARVYGLGLAPLGRSSPDLIAAVRELSPSARIYCNVPGAIYALIDRVVYDLPWRVSPTSLKRNERFDADLAQIADGADGQRTYLILFDSGSPLETTRKDATSILPVINERFFPGGEIAVIGPR
jgi:hypothetical protein